MNDQTLNRPVKASTVHAYKQIGIRLTARQAFEGSIIPKLYRYLEDLSPGLPRSSAARRKHRQKRMLQRQETNVACLPRNFVENGLDGDNGLLGFLGRQNLPWLDFLDRRQFQQACLGMK